jgi:hypothetical protein
MAASAKSGSSGYCIAERHEDGHPGAPPAIFRMMASTAVGVTGSSSRSADAMLSCCMSATWFCVSGVPGRTTHLTDRDLEEDLRRHGMTSVEGVAEARLERNGDIKSKQEPKVITIAVADGVHTVRIEMA